MKPFHPPKRIILWTLFFLSLSAQVLLGHSASEIIGESGFKADW